MDTSTTEMVDELIALNRVPLQYVEGARRRFGALPPAELSAKLDQVREDARVLRNWRSELVAPSGPFLTEDLADRLASSVTAHVRKHVIEEFRKRFIATAEVGRLHPKNRPRYSRIIAEILRDDRNTAKILSRLEIERVIFKSSPQNHPLIGGAAKGMAVTEYVEALGRIRNDLSRIKPEIIVTLNAEGENVYQFFNAINTLSAPLCRVTTGASEHISWSGGLVVPDGSIVCVVGHVTHSGQTMRRVINEAKERYKTPKVFGAILAASEESIFNSLKDLDIVYHQSSGDTKLNLGQRYDHKTPKKHDYIIDSHGITTAIPEQFMNEVQKTMRHRYPASKLSWENKI